MHDTPSTSSNPEGVRQKLLATIQATRQRAVNLVRSGEDASKEITDLSQAQIMVDVHEEAARQEQIDAQAVLDAQARAAYEKDLTKLRVLCKKRNALLDESKTLFEQADAKLGEALSVPMQSGKASTRAKSHTAQAIGLLVFRHMPTLNRLVRGGESRSLRDDGIAALKVSV